MLGVVQLHPMSDRLAELVCDRLVAHAEVPQLLRIPRAHVLTPAVVQRDLSLVSLAKHSAPHELLQHAGAFALGIGPSQGEPGPKAAADDQQQNKGENPAPETIAGSAGAS